MTHDELRDRLGAYLDGELDDTQRAALEAHLASCKSCRGELEALRALDGELANQSVPDPGDAYWARFAARVTERLRPQPAPEPARLYERLTGWLFPRGRFAWARAAVAVATCTLLVTVGLHGFRTAEVAVRPQPPVVRSRPAEPPASMGPRDEPLGIPPRAQPAPDRTSKSEVDVPNPDEEVSGNVEVLEKRERGTAATPSRTATDEGAATPVTPQAAHDVDEGAGRSGPSSLHIETEARPAPETPTDTRHQVEAKPQVVQDQSGIFKLRGGRSLGSETVQPEGSPPPAGLEKKDAASGTSQLRDDAASRQQIEPVPESPAQPSVRKLPGAAAPLITTQGGPRKKGVAWSPSPAGPPTAPAEAESLLAREARLWPVRDDAAMRPQLEALAHDLAMHADDARVRARARELLGWLAATSASAEDADHWRALIRSLPEP